MYPDLSYLFHALFGTPVDNWLSIFKTFGFFLAIAFLVAAFVFYLELKRKALEGFYKPTIVRRAYGLPASTTDIVVNLLVGLLAGGKAGYAWHHFNAFRMDPASVVLSSKMNWAWGIIGALLFGGLVWYDAWRKRKSVPDIREEAIYPHDRISEMTIWAAAGGIVGAKVFDLFDNWEAFMKDPIGSLTSGGGLAFYGGLLVGFVLVVWYISRHKIPFWPTADAVAPALATGYGVGRIGCQLSGDGDWGIVNNAPKPDWMGFLPDWLWSSRYPHHVINHPFTQPVPSVAIDGCKWDYCLQLSEPVYPTPLYEIMMMLVVFGILWAFRKRLAVPGMLFFLYLGLIAAERYFIEKIRVNVVHDVAGIPMTQAEIISTALFVMACVGIVLRGKQGERGR
jgi:prolipoprotein diacylglyceryl transferase